MEKLDAFLHKKNLHLGLLRLTCGQQQLPGAGQEDLCQGLGQQTARLARARFSQRIQGSNSFPDTFCKIRNMIKYEDNLVTKPSSRGACLGWFILWAPSGPLDLAAEKSASPPFCISGLPLAGPLVCSKISKSTRKQVKFKCVSLTCVLHFPAANG